MKKYSFIFVLLICMILVGCSAPTKEQKNIYNDERLMASEGDSYYSKKIDDKELNSIYFENFTGSYTIWEKQIEESDDVNITFNCDIKKGKYKIVLIKDNKMYEIIINNEEVVDRKIKYSLGSGNYKIKVIGLYSSLNIKYEIK